MDDGYHPPIEEYLETIWGLSEEGTPVIGARIAERLGRSAPSVSEMLERLEEEGYVRRRGRRVELTAAGAALAEKVVRRHRLAERLLVDVIGLEWHKVHREAGRWEHVISDDVEARLLVLLGNPTTCPHGNPIPGAHAPGGPPPAPLTEVPAGSRVRLQRISEDVEMDMGWLTFLGDHRFTPGATATVGDRVADGSLWLDVDGSRVQVEPELASRLFVAAV